MPSRALDKWHTDRAACLDEIEAAHRSVGGTGPGRRFATREINHAYTLLLSAQFQGFCRDLHTEAADLIAKFLPQVPYQNLLRGELYTNRKLDHGNPIPGNIGADYNRLGVQFWPNVLARDARNAGRRDQLEQLNRWRNAIAHQQFDPALLGGVTLHLAQVRAWRSACNELAKSFDDVASVAVRAFTGMAPW